MVGNLTSDHFWVHLGPLVLGLQSCRCVVVGAGDNKQGGPIRGQTQGSRPIRGSGWDQESRDLSRESCRVQIAGHEFNDPG